MSGIRVKPDIPTAAPQPRRTVSVYEKMQEARERRAALLSASEPANLPTAARLDTTPELKPEPIELRDTVAETVVFGPEPEKAPARRSATKWTIRGLVVLLAALVTIAVFTAKVPSPGPGPVFAPPLASLSDPALGAPLLVVVSPTPDQIVVPAPVPEVLPVVTAAPVPAPAPAPPQQKGPELTDTIAIPAPPSATPAALITLPNDILPPERPEFTSADQTNG